MALTVTLTAAQRQVVLAPFVAEFGEDYIQLGRVVACLELALLDVLGNEQDWRTPLEAEAQKQLAAGGLTISWWTAECERFADASKVNAVVVVNGGR